LKELDSDARAFFLQHFPKASPSVVHADFDGDGQLDYALLFSPVFAKLQPASPSRLGPKSFSVISFADPHPINPVVSILYKHGGGVASKTQIALPYLPSSVRSSKFPIL
jgi:hypothetical protein